MTNPYDKNRLTVPEFDLFRRIVDEAPRVDTLSTPDWATLRGLVIKGFATLYQIGPHTSGEPDTPQCTVVNAIGGISDLIKADWMQRNPSNPQTDIARRG